MRFWTAFTVAGPVLATLRAARGATVTVAVPGTLSVVAVVVSIWATLMCATAVLTYEPGGLEIETSKVRSRVPPAGMVNALTHVRFAPEIEGSAIAAPLNWAVPATYAAAPGDEGSTSTMSSRLTSLQLGSSGGQPEFEAVLKNRIR